MVDFKSDLIDADGAYSFIPTGAVLTKLGAYSEYSSGDMLSIGLIPCDGRLLDGSVGQQYNNLWNVIGLKYGGTSQSSFRVPSLIDLKRVVYGAANSAELGTKTTGIHSHAMFTEAGNRPTVNVITNADIYTHTHSATFNTGNQATSHDNVHGAAAFNIASPAPSTGLRAKADGTSQAASVGHTHGTWTIRPGSSGGMIINANHAHNNITVNTNASTTAEGQHVHTYTINVSGSIGNSSFFPPNQDVLFFIKA